MRTFVSLLPSILIEVDSLLLKLILFDAACELGVHFQCAWRERNCEQVRNNKSRGMGWGKQWIFAFPSPLLLHFSPQVHSFSCSLTWSPHLGNGNEMSATQAIFNVNVIHSVMCLITFETHLNVHYIKCSTIRNQSLAGKADLQRYSCIFFNLVMKATCYQLGSVLFSEEIISTNCKFNEKLTPCN